MVGKNGAAGEGQYGVSRLCRVGAVRGGLTPLDRNTDQIDRAGRDSDGSAQVERRGRRRRVFKGGIVAFNDRRSTLACVVRDVSETGAHLRVEGSMNAPDTFELIIDLDGLEADCEVVWRKGSEVGVRFRSPPRRFTPRRTQVVDALAPMHKPSLRRKSPG
jgi:hypothetical protein